MGLAAAIVCIRWQYYLNFLVASSNQGAYNIFETQDCTPPFNWSANAVNAISADIEHVSRGNDYSEFDGLTDQPLVISKGPGCWFGEQYCLDGTIGNLGLHFKADKSQLGVLSRKRITIEARSNCSQVDVDKVVLETGQKFSNANSTTIAIFEFGTLSQNGTIAPVMWSQFAAITTTHGTDLTTFWADASGKPGNNSFPSGFNLINAHLTFVFLPATSIPHVDGSGVDSLFGKWNFSYGNITTAYSKLRLLACRDDAKLCVGDDCTPYGGSDQVTPTAERLFKQKGIPRDFIWISTHAAGGMISGPVRLLRNKALMVNDFVAEGNTLDISGYAIPEVIRWFALSAAATAALPGRCASGYFGRKWVISGVTGGTAPPVTGDSVSGPTANSTGHPAGTANSRIPNPKSRRVSRAVVMHGVAKYGVV